MNKLLLHKGAQPATIDEVNSIPAPAHTNTWAPIAHGDYIQIVKDEIEAQGWGIQSQEYGLKSGKLNEDEVVGAKLFGIIELEPHKSDSEFSMCFGLRSSIDKSIPIGLFWGDSMFVCDNMMYSGEGELIKKHYPGNMAELTSQVADVVEDIDKKAKQRELTYEFYKSVHFTSDKFNDLAVRAMMKGVLPPSKMRELVNEWVNPRHKEFREPTLFNAMNAFTEIAKTTPIVDAPIRLSALSELIEDYCRA